MPSTPPRCETLVGWGPLSSWISPVLVTWQVRSSQHCRPFDSVIIGSFLMTSLSPRLTLSPKWRDLVTWMTRLALSSLTPLFLSVSVIWLTWHCQMWYTYGDDDDVGIILFDNYIIIINWILSYLLMRRFQKVGVTMKSPFQVANWSSRLVSTFHHLLLQYITCRTMHVTMHVTHCISHIALYITTHALTCLFQISCSSFCFVSALIVSGQVIPLHIASADFETALVCLYVTHSILHIDCFT